MANCLYYNATEVQALLGVSRSKAYQIIKELNEWLQKNNYIVIPGKVPRQLLNERVFGAQ